MREGVALGAILIRRIEVRPFSEQQIKLLETFADQAVIAIENVRLFKEIQERNAELREALEHQTATAEVLGIISRSPTDVQPVLDAIVESAARVCGIDDVLLRLREGNSMVLRAHFGSVPIGRGAEISIDEPQYRWMREHGALHIPDVRAQNEFPGIGSGRNSRTFLVVPLLQKGELIGVMNSRRTEVRPFTPAQIKLLETFADQAVIAIENVRLFKELEERNRQITEALEQQTATSEILQVIAGSPTNIQPVLDTVIANAVKLAGAKQGHIRQYDGEFLKLVAHCNESPEIVATLTPSRPVPESLNGRAFLERRPVQRVNGQSEYIDSRTQYQSPGQQAGARTALAVPLMREGLATGTILIWRDFVQPFTDRQIELVKTFADQAVIAIENVRLFNEVQERNRDLTEALEQQTATGEVLRVIASSPTELQPVLDTLLANAVKLSGAKQGHIRQSDGEFLRVVAHCNERPERIALLQSNPLPLRSNIAAAQAFLECKPIHVLDTQVAALGFQVLARQTGVRTLLAVPLLREGTGIGTITIWRDFVEPFTERQIELVKTFADQAVIAIENVRLFQELKESLEQQTAMSEILGVIASSPTDIQPVLDAVAASAARLCDANDAIIHRREGELARVVAFYGPMGLTRPVGEGFRPTRSDPPGRAMLDGKTVHVDDIVAELDGEFPESRAHQRISGSRTILVTPLLREGASIGSVMIRRTEVRPFADKQIKLLETFASQAVIAIENVRLFNELDARNRQLTEALEQLTATSEILRVIASSPTDIQPVLDAVAENATRLCDAKDVSIGLVEGDVLKVVASYGMMARWWPDEGVPINRGSVTGRTIVDRQPIHVHDLASESDEEFPLGKIYQKRGGHRTNLGIPLLRKGVPIGVIAIRRMEVRPFSEKQIALLKTFADQAVIAIENVRLFQELDTRTRELARSVGELKALGEVGQAVSSTLDLQTVLNTIVARAVQLSGTDCGIIYEYDEPTQEFHLQASYQMEEELVNAYQATPLRLGEGATGRAAETRTPTQIADLRGEQEFATRGLRPILSRLGYQSLTAVPLLLDQKIMGALTIYRRETGRFAPEIVNLLQTFATQSVLAIQNARLFREIEDKGRELEAANRHKSEFLANVSHELRTPLNAIIGFSEVLQERFFGELNEKQAEYTDDILSSGRHLLSLINDILDLSKIEAGRMELEVTTFDLPMAIENALLLIRERASRHGIRLDRVIDDRLGDFTGDERKVKQVLVNLLSNAVKFTPEGGQIKVEARLGDNAVI